MVVALTAVGTVGIDHNTAVVVPAGTFVATERAVGPYIAHNTSVHTSVVSSHSIASVLAAVLLVTLAAPVLHPNSKHCY